VQHDDGVGHRHRVPAASQHTPADAYGLLRAKRREGTEPQGQAATA